MNKISLQIAFVQNLISLKQSVIDFGLGEYHSPITAVFQYSLIGYVSVICISNIRFYLII